MILTIQLIVVDARQMVYTTAWRFDNGEYPVREISMAKLYASRMSVEIADECIQIHGGAGYMKEYGIERVWRDVPRRIARQVNVHSAIWRLRARRGSRGVQL